MNRALYRAALALAGVAMMGLAPSPASAQGAVYCANCADEVTQWLNYLKLLAQLEKQTSTLQLTIRNTTALGSFPSGTGANANSGLADIRALIAILSQARSLSYASSSLDAQFSQKFKDYNGYANGGAKLDNQAMAAKYQQWSSDANSSTQTTLKAVGLQNQQIQGDEEQALQKLEAQAKTAQGNLETQQLALALAIQTVRQLQKLRELIMMDIQLAANHGQTREDRAATEAAAWKKFTAPVDVPTTGGKTYRGGE